MISETACSSQTKLIGLNLHLLEHGIGYSNLTPDPQGARGAPGVKIQVSPNQKTSLTKVVRHHKGMIKISSAPPEELGKPGFPSVTIKARGNMLSTPTLTEKATIHIAKQC